MKVFIGSDHAGFKLKEVLKNYLNELGLEVYDKGANDFDPEDDYTVFIAPVAKAVSLEHKTSRGIVIGKSGQGEAMLANGYPNVRATVYYGGGSEIVSLGRVHNNSNILALGAGFLSVDEAMNAVKVWLNTPFSHEEKYERRIEKAETIKKEILGPK